MRGENQNVPSAYPSYWYISCLDNAELSYSYKYSHRPALISVGTYWLRGPDPLPPEGRYASGSKSRRGFQIGITLMPCPLCVRNKLTSWSKRNFILGCDACWALAAPIPPPPREFEGIRWSTGHYISSWRSHPCSSAMTQVARSPSMLGLCFFCFFLQLDMGPRVKQNATPRCQYLPSIPSPTLKKFPRFTKGGSDEGFHRY